MKLIVGPATFKQHQRHCSEKKRCRNKPAAVQMCIAGTGGQTQHSDTDTHLRLGLHHLHTILVQRVFSLSASQLLASNIQRKL